MMISLIVIPCVYLKFGSVMEILTVPMAMTKRSVKVRQNERRYLCHREFYDLNLRSKYIRKYCKQAYVVRYVISHQIHVL